jgi:hypothetical protein
LAEACRELGCDFAEPEGPLERLWRVEVERDTAGDFSIRAVASVEVVEGSGVPLAPANGDVYVIGLDEAGERIDGQAVRFVDVAVVEDPVSTRTVEEVPLDGIDLVQIGYVRARPEITRIALWDGDLQTELDARDVAAEDADDVAISQTSSGLKTVLSNVCGHITLVEEERIGPFGVALPLGGFQYRTMIQALQRLPPTQCHSVARIAFARFNPNLNAAVAGSMGDLIVINEDWIPPEADEANPIRPFTDAEQQSSARWRLKLVQTIIHESAHTANLLFDFRDAPVTGERGEWDRAASGRADSLLSRTRLAKGLIPEWTRMHQSFVDQGWARPHGMSLGDGSNGDFDAFARAGVMSPYGILKPMEDLAEIVAWVTMTEDFGRRAITPDGQVRADFGCIAMAGHTGSGGVPSRFAALYAKIALLLDLEMIDSNEAENCLSSVGLRDDLPPGMHFANGAGAEPTTRFTSDIEAGIGTVDDGRRVFFARASGQASLPGGSFPAEALLHITVGGSGDLELISWPRGVYPLSLTGPHQFFLTFDDDDNRAGNFTSEEGFVLVTRASNDLIRGSIFLRQARRLQAPLAPPQVFDPPLIVNVVLEN